MKLFSLVCLAALAALVAGCPHNDYTVELTPREKVVERQLVFYRADGTDTNGAPKYVPFPSNELAAITALYPADHLTQEGERHFAKGDFSNAMPGDVGGAGSYRQLATSLGTAGFYVERFRGSDDLAARANAQLAAADQLTDLVIGWSRAEFGREPGYKKLRRFLDGDFRRDLKNLSLYSWAGEISSAYGKGANEEFIVRFGQYLHERGYLRIEDAASLVQVYAGGDDARGLLLVQKFLAEKLGVPPAGPMPKSLALLADPAAADQSWKKYLTGTELYQARLRQWKKDKKLQPDLEKPEPAEPVGELASTLPAFGSTGEEDHLTVRLTLTAAPDHTNGKWDATRSQMVWESGLESREPAARLPVFCFANWTQPDEGFQREHFGRVALNGDELLKYCLWRGGLHVALADEWEKLLTSCRPGGELTNRLAAFEFSVPGNTNAAALGKKLLHAALENIP